jgi:hypothetical protein
MQGMNGSFHLVTRFCCLIGLLRYNPLYLMVVKVFNITPAIKYLDQRHSGERQNPGKQPGCRSNN